LAMGRFVSGYNPHSVPTKNQDDGLAT